MVYIEIILAIFIAIFIIWFLHRMPPNFPPGPIVIPFLGDVAFLISKEPHVMLGNMKSKFGSVLGMPLGLRGYGIVINDWKGMKEAMVQQGDAFAGRPFSFMMNEFFKQNDIVGVEGQLWKDKRRFSLQHLRDFGFGKQSMESIIAEEVEKVVEIFGKNPLIDQKTDFLFLPILNVIWGIVAGKKYSLDDAYMQTFSEPLQMFLQDFQSLLFLNNFPLLRFLPGPLKRYRRMVKNREKVMEFVNAEYLGHTQTYKEGIARDFIDVYLAEIYRQKKSAQPNPAFEAEQLLGVIFDFFGAGVETTKNTLMWAYLYMSTWPEIQEKVQQELDTVIGRERVPQYSDRLLLPYTEATLLEVQRYATIIPFSVPHKTMRATTLLGFTIPKNTVVLQNLWSVHNDKEYWGDPEIFRPERFLKDGKVERPECLIPFSTGPRACLGEPLARIEMFLFFTGILQRYSLSLATGIKPPGLDPIPSITLRPNPFTLSTIRRF